MLPATANVYMGGGASRLPARCRSSPVRAGHPRLNRREEQNSRDGDDAGQQRILDQVLSGIVSDELPDEEADSMRRAPTPVDQHRPVTPTSVYSSGPEVSSLRAWQRSGS